MKLEQYLITEMATSNAAYDETAACIGIIIPEEYIGIIKKVAEHKGKTPFKIEKNDEENRKKEKNRKNAQKAHGYIMATLDQSGYDWNTTGVDLIKKVEPTNYVAIADLCRVIYGMYLFVQNRILQYIPKPKLNFIHGSITSYRRVETSRVAEKEPSEKANTADVVITNAKNVQELDDALEKSQLEVHPEPHEGYATAGEHILFQISLKKSLQARLGKATPAAKEKELIPTDIKSTYVKQLVKGIKPTMSFKDLTRWGDSLVPYGSRLNELDEGVLQTVGSFLKKAYTWVMDKIRHLLSALKAEVSSVFKTKPTQRDFIDVLRLYKTNEEIEELLDELNEDEKKDLDKPIAEIEILVPPGKVPSAEELYVKRKKKVDGKEVMSYKFVTGKIEQEVVLAVASDPATIIKRINEKIREAKKLTMGTDIVIHIELIPAYQDVSGNRTEIIQTCFSLACNYVTANFIINFISKADKMSDNIKAIIKSMKFGGTKMPMWKVFGYPTEPEYLGTTNAVVSLPAESVDLIDPFGVSAHPNTKGYGLGEYYVFNILMIEDLSEDEKTYIRIRSGSFSGSHISYAIEGDQLDGPYKIETKMEKILKGIKDE